MDALALASALVLRACLRKRKRRSALRADALRSLVGRKWENARLAALPPPLFFGLSSSLFLRHSSKKGESPKKSGERAASLRLCSEYRLHRLTPPPLKGSAGSTFVYFRSKARKKRAVALARFFLKKS